MAGNTASRPPYRTRICGSTVESLEFGKYLDWLGSSDPSQSSPGHAKNPSNRLLGVYTLLALALIVAGSERFVSEIEWFSGHVLAIPTLVTALLAAPFASNAPEVVDGLIWIDRERDTLAVDQLTGALAFQGRCWLQSASRSPPGISRHSGRRLAGSRRPSSSDRSFRGPAVSPDSSVGWRWDRSGDLRRARSDLSGLPPVGRVLRPCRIRRVTPVIKERDDELGT